MPPNYGRRVYYKRQSRSKESSVSPSHHAQRGSNFSLIASSIMTPSDHLPTWKRAAYGVGALADFLIFALINVMLIPVYVVALKLDPRLIGYAAALPRFVGVITDPIIGAISDNTRTRWGRRRPFFVVGAILCGTMLPLVWFPVTGFGNIGTFIYLFLILAVFQAVYSLYIVPFGALGYELTGDPDERTRVLAWCPYLTTIGTFAAPWFYWLSLRPVFGCNEVTGVRWMSIGAGVAIIVCGVIPALIFREKAQAPRRSGEKVNVLGAVRETVRSRAFLLLVGANVLATFAVNCQGTIILYITIYYMFAGDKAATTQLGGIVGTVVSLSTFLILPLITRLSAGRGKRSALLVSLAMCSIAGMATWWVFSPRWPYLMMIYSVIGYGGMTATSLMVSSMTADVCDEDELRTGKRREGAFASAMGATLKATLAVMLVVGGYLPSMAGYTDVSHPPTMNQLFNMRILFAAIQGLLPLIGMALIWFYPITKSRALEIRRSLDNRGTTPLSAIPIEN